MLRLMKVSSNGLIVDLIDCLKDVGNLVSRTFFTNLVVLYNPLGDGNSVVKLSNFLMNLESSFAFREIYVGTTDYVSFSEISGTFNLSIEFWSI